MRKNSIHHAHYLQATVLGIALVLCWSDANTAPDEYGCELRTITTSYTRPSGADLRCPKQINSLNRSYVLCIPPSLRAQLVANRNAAPLVLAFHGAGENSSGESFRGRVQFEIRGRADGFITAYPNGCRQSDGPPQTLVCDGGNWNAQASPPDGVAESCKIDDTGFIVQQVIPDVRSHYPVKTDRILAFGHSKGGVFVYSLACDRASTFAAIGVTAATKTDATCTPTNAPALFHVHNLQDTNVPFFGGGRIQIWPPVEPGLQFLAGKNGCVLPTEDHDFSAAMCLEGANCQSRSAELCLLGTDALDALGDNPTNPNSPHLYRTYDSAFTANQGISIGDAFLNKFLP